MKTRIDMNVDKAAMFLEQTLITDVPLRVVRAAAALAPDHSAVAGRLLVGIEAAAASDRVSGLVHVDEARRLWAVAEAARRLCGTKCSTCGAGGLDLVGLVTHDCAPRRDPGHRVGLWVAGAGHPAYSVREALALVRKIGAPDGA